MSPLMNPRVVHKNDRTFVELVEKPQKKGAEPKPRLVGDSKERKMQPMAAGLLDYFPDALAAVALVSWWGNQQHNPGQPTHWARSKSTDHADCIVRHLVDRGLKDVDGMPHSAKLAWRALALLQEEIEKENSLPPSRGSKV